MPLDRIGRNTLSRGTVLGGGYFWLLLGDRLALAENGEVEGWMKDCKKKDGDCYHPECKRDDGIATHIPSRIRNSFSSCMSVEPQPRAISGMLIQSATVYEPVLFDLPVNTPDEDSAVGNNDGVQIGVELAAFFGTLLVHFHV